MLPIIFAAKFLQLLPHLPHSDNDQHDPEETVFQMQEIIQSSVSFITMLTFPLNFIIVVIILFTIIKIKNMYKFSTH